MAEPRVPENTRRLVAERSRGSCEYCRVIENYCVDPFCVEHITPRTAGGSNDPVNLAWSCQGCNSYKYDAVEARDPLTGEIAPLFNPRTDHWVSHFAWSADSTEVIGLTPSGRATVDRLRLNRPSLLNLRRLLSAAGLHPPAPPG